MSSALDQALAADFNAISPVPSSLASAVSSLQTLTTTTPHDTSFTAVKGILYGRKSWRRVRLVSNGNEGTLTVPAGHAQADVEAICQMFMSESNPPGGICAMSVSAIYAEIVSNLSLLETSKMSDGKGVLWASGELASGDPGDSAYLLSALVNITEPKYIPEPTIADLERLQSQGLISASIPVA